MTPMPKRTEALALAELIEVESAIATCEAATSKNYERRLALLEELTGMGLAVGAVAEAVGQREGTYRQALYKARQRAGVTA